MFDQCASSVINYGAYTLTLTKASAHELMVWMKRSMLEVSFILEMKIYREERRHSSVCTKSQTQVEVGWTCGKNDEREIDEQAA